MEFRILGRTGLKVSVFGIGSWQLSGPLTLDGQPDGFPDIGREKAIALIKAGGALGMNLIDSAELYGDGEGERRVGDAVRGSRDRWILSTKFGMRRGSNGERIVDTRPCMIRSSIERSLRRLQTDYVDVYLYHSAPDPASINEGKGILEKLKQEGKIRFYGISTNHPEHLGQLIAHKAVEVVMLSQSLLTHPSKILESAKTHDLGMMIRGALERGRLSGKYFHCKPDFHDQDIRKHADKATDFHKYAAYERFLPEGVPMATFALRYLIDLETTQTIILGGTRIEHYQQAVKAFDLPRLDIRTRLTLQRVSKKLTNGSLARRVSRRFYRAAARLAGSGRKQRIPDTSERRV